MSPPAKLACSNHAHTIHQPLEILAATCLHSIHTPHYRLSASQAGPGCTHLHCHDAVHTVHSHTYKSCEVNCFCGIHCSVMTKPCIQRDHSLTHVHISLWLIPFNAIYTHTSKYVVLCRMQRAVNMMNTTFHKQSVDEYLHGLQQLGNIQYPG